MKTWTSQQGLDLGAARQLRRHLPALRRRAEVARSLGMSPRSMDVLELRALAKVCRGLRVERAEQMEGRKG